MSTDRTVGPDNVRGAIDGDDLRAAGLGDLFETLGAAVDPDAGRNVAVVSEPYAGREVLLDNVATTASSVERRTLEGLAAGPPAFGDADVAVVDDCHYLYTREIGGFDALDEFLNWAVTAGAAVVTSWNRYAWEYLRAVRDVDDLFAEVVEVPALEPEAVADLLLSNHAGTMPAFVETGDEESVRTLDIERREVELPGGRRATVPVPGLNLAYLASWTLSRSDDIADAQAVVFRKIAGLANGNPGVAASVWERSRQDGEIAPAYVETPEPDLDLDDNEAFVLEVLLTKDRLSLSALDRVLDQLPVERLVRGLEQRGLVQFDDERVAVGPTSLHAVVDHLRGRRLVW